MCMKKVELLAPAGNMDSLKAAVMAGCDAVYLGGVLFGARAFAGNFTNEEIVDAINYANNALLKLNEVTQEFDINIFETLGMRNLSGMVGEYFARSIMRLSNGRLQSNLHQDGYPDLLLRHIFQPNPFRLQNRRLI